MRSLTMLRRASLLPLAMLVAGIPSAMPVDGSAVPVTQIVSLRDMAKSPVSIEAGDFVPDRAFRTATRTFAFSLPIGTVPRGVGRPWFLVNLSFRITFDEDSAPGYAWVSAATNSATAAQLEYEVTRAGAPMVRESRVTLVDGQQVRDLDGLATDVEYTNYARQQGLHDGANTFTVRLEHTEGVKITRIELGERTGVLRTEKTPYPLGLNTSTPPAEIRVGDEFTVEVTLENRTDESQRNVSIEVAPAAEIARSIDGRTRAVGDLEGTQKQLFRFKALRSGPGQISVLGSSNRNMPSATVEFTVLPFSGNSARSLALILAAGALPLLALISFALVRARMRTRGRPS